MSEASKPIIELKNVTFAAQGKTVVEDISISFNQGETVALVGPSGCGKSTVLKLAGGLILPSRGEVRYKGKDIFSMTRQENLEFRRESAFVFQDSALWANQSLRQILELPLKTHYPRMTQRQITSRVVETVAEAGYKKDLDIRPSQLSMGEQKLIAFSRAMMCAPSTLFLDEWTESLDDAGERRLVNAVRKRKQEGSTIIFVSHNFDIIKKLADRICMIVEGKLSLSVSAEEFAKNESLSKTIEEGITT
jgi:ABC-type multidrug transport system ATPase subunit